MDHRFRSLKIDHRCFIFALLLDYFMILSTISLWVQTDFFLVMSITWPYQIKKILNSKILSMWVFVAPKCWQNFEILQLAWTLAPNKFWTKCLKCLIFAQTIVFHLYFMEITTLTFILLQLSHNSINLKIA